MNKEKLLKLVDDKIGEIQKQIEERTDIIQRTGKRLEVQIDPSEMDSYNYQRNMKERLNRHIDQDEQLRKWRYQINRLKEYNQFIKLYCNNYNVHCFGLP
jgi:hypothetical protein